MSSEGLSRAAIRERSQQAQELKNAIRTQTPRDPQYKINQLLAQNITRLNKNITKLNESILRLDQTTRRQTGPAGRGGGGLPGPGTGGGGAGGMGASLPFVGAAIAAFGFAMNKVMQIGQANLVKRMEQAQTVGVAGFQRSGRQLDVFTAGEFGQYLKERRMQAGSFDAGGERGADYRGGTDVTKAKQMSFKHMALFGTSPADMGRTIGTLDVLTGGRGEVGFNEMYANLFRKEGGKIKGPETQLPLVLQEITSRMQEAVTAGVIDSNMAKDMAREYSRFATVAEPGQAKFILEAQKSLMNVQTAVSKGQLAGQAGFRMRMVTRDLIRGEGPESEKIRKQLEESGLFDPGTDFRKMSPEAMQTAVQYLNQAQSADVRNAFIRSTVETYAGKGTEYEQFHVFRQNMMGLMPEIASDPKRAKLLFDVIKKEQTGQLTSDETNDEINRLLQAEDKNEVRQAKTMSGERERLLLGPAGEAAADAFIKVETTMVGFADKMAGPVAAGIDTFLDGVELAADGMDALFEGLKSLREEIQQIKEVGFGGYLKEAIF